MGGVLATPTGEHSVILKQASRHMSNVPYADMKPEDRPAPGDIFDLPGVPWNTFIDLAGTAIHGAYWHNDFGVRRSHGCVNVSHDAARFVYRWTYPIGGYDDDFVQSNARVGTPVIVRLVITGGLARSRLPCSRAVIQAYLVFLSPRGWRQLSYHNRIAGRRGDLIGGNHRIGDSRKR